MRYSSYNNLDCRWQLDTKVKANSTMENLIQVDCNNGKSITCEHVICTLPLGVLKEHATQIFEPCLTAQKLRSIDKLMFGTVDKIILEYEKPFLSADISEIMLLWDDQSLLDQKTVEPSWFRKIYSFSKLSDTLLLCWISGKAAEHMERLSDNEVSKVCTNVLRSFLKDPTVPLPKSCARTNWRSQPYTRGSYTAISVGANQQDIENLAKPLTKLNDSSKIKVAFAGEHTHSSFYSTVHGAYLSGRSAAQAVIESRRKDKQNVITCERTNDFSSWIQGINLN